MAGWADRHIKWLLVIPVVILILAIAIFPLGYSLWVSFVQFDFRLEGHPWIGLDNYKDVVSNAVWQASLWRTLALAAAVVFVELIFGLALALAMVRPFVGRRFLIPIFIFPLFMAPVAVGQTWKLLWDNQFGPINWILSQIFPGDVEILWKSENPWTWITIIVTDAWQWTPFMFIILLAGLVAIPEDVYEASSLDGANWWQQFREITLPLLTPIMIVAIAFRLIDALKLFDIVFVLTQGGPGSSTFTQSYWIYETGFRLFNFGPASAASWIFLVLIALVSYWLVRRLLTPTEA